MVWFFERGRESQTLETRFDASDDTFILIWTHENGGTTTERFATQEAFKARLTAVEATLSADHWLRSGPPVILPDGWKP
jgi:hypothetical protein